MLDEIKMRLKSLGYEVNSEDDVLLEYIQKKIEESVKNLTNLSEIPEGLHYKIVEAVCADFLDTKFSSGGLEAVEGVVTSIREGDTQVSYDKDSTPQTRFLNLLDGMRIKLSELYVYRVIKW